MRLNAPKWAQGIAEYFNDFPGLGEQVQEALARPSVANLPELWSNVVAATSQISSMKVQEGLKLLRSYSKLFGYAVA